MLENNTWLGVAVLMLAEGHPKRSEGFVGAFAPFSCKAADIAEALVLVRDEFRESGYLLVGINKMSLVEMLDRTPTHCEEELIADTAIYPVQFKHIHLHKGDA